MYCMSLVENGPTGRRAGVVSDVGFCSRKVTHGQQSFQ